jgi:hypothetical protein
LTILRHKERNMKTTLMTAALVAALGLSGVSHALTKAEHDGELNRLSANFEAAKRSCDTMNGNARDICMAEANGAHKVGKAELAARYTGTLQARYEAQVARADADYDIAKERCDDFAGNAKDVCLKDAKAALVRAKAGAKIDRETRQANKEGAQKVADARRDADNDVRKAEYAAAVERCDSFSGSAKDRCVADAKMRFGMK